MRLRVVVGETMQACSNCGFSVGQGMISCPNCAMALGLPSASRGSRLPTSQPLPPPGASGLPPTGPRGGLSTAVTLIVAALVGLGAVATVMGLWYVLSEHVFGEEEQDMGDDGSLQADDSTIPMQMVSTLDSNGNYHLQVIRMSNKVDLENYYYRLKDGSHNTQQAGHICLQNLSGQWQGIDVTWDDDGSADTTPGNDRADRSGSAGGAYPDPIQAQIRIDDVQAGRQNDKSFQKSEGTISVSFFDNDRDGSLTSGDQFLIQGNSATHPAADEWELEIMSVITGDIMTVQRLG